MKVMTVATVLIMALIAGVVLQTATSGELKQFAEESGEWCDEHNGTLYNAQVIGEHGGLHCELPNGTSVHMDEVITMQETDQ